MWVYAAALVGTLMVAFVLWDAFETILLPRTVMRRFRLTRLFYQVNWTPWAAIGRRLPPGVEREHFLGLFAPLSLLLLITFWAFVLIGGFGRPLAQQPHGSGSNISCAPQITRQVHRLCRMDFPLCLYVVSFFSLCLRS